MAVNPAVIDAPGMAFADPYGEGWLFKVKSNNLTSNMKNIIPKGMVGEWFENVRQTLATKGLAPGSAPLSADCGKPVGGLAKAVDPGAWDDLAREFFLTK